MSTSDSSGEFSIAEARAIVQDLFEPRLSVYWTDFLVSITLGMAGFTAYLLLPFESPWLYIGYVVAVLAFYRASLFTHELVHLKGKQFQSFRIVWNLFCGIPFLMPSFMYYTHVAHHARKHYGTTDDGEYLPLAVGPVWKIFFYLSQPFVLPLIATARFLIFAPLGWCFPPLRRLLHQRASSMVMDPSYIRPLPTHQELRVWRLQEAACFLVCLGLVLLFIIGRPIVNGRPLVDGVYLLKLYAIAVGVLLLNQVRTLGAHRFRNPGGEEMTFLEQLLDSLNFPEHRWSGELWGPVGLRFHALHHLFPSMPYHALETAHHRLMERLPADSPYRQTVRRSLPQALGELFASSWNYRSAARHPGGQPGGSSPTPAMPISELPQASAADESALA